MSVNKYKPHILVLPEDDAVSDLANGFQLELSEQMFRNMDVLRAARGWHRVLETFRVDHVRAMETYQHRFMVLLIDFDGHEDRLGHVKAQIPESLRNRVFVLGVLQEPEDLTADLGRTCEQIGREMAIDCREGNDEIWSHDLLRHNANELARLRVHVRPLLFESV